MVRCLKKGHRYLSGIAKQIIELKKRHLLHGIVNESSDNE